MPEKILVVDDHIETLRLIGLVLERQGYEIIVASNGPNALALVHSVQPDLILLDLMMPGIDGYDVARQIRNGEDTKDIPIIIFSAKNQVEDRLLGFEVGADDYLPKPVQTRELVARVKAVLARTARARTTLPRHERGHLMAIMAPKGGLGVTTVVINLAIAIRKMTEKEVIVADFRPGQGSLSLELGYDQPEGFNRLLQCKSHEITRRSVEVELVFHSSAIRLLLSSPQPRDAKFSSEIDQFVAIARILPKLAHYTLLDLGPGLSPLNEKVVNLCDEVLVVVEPVPQTVLQAKYLIQDLVNNGLGEGQVQAILVNRVRSTVQLNLTQVQDQLGRKVFTVSTPDPETAFMASTRKVPMIIQQPESLAAQQIFKFADQIHQRIG